MTETPAFKTVPPQPGDRLFVFRELEHPDGGTPRTLAFTGVDIKPRGYEELAAAKADQPVTIPLGMSNAEIVETDVEDFDISRKARINTILESPFTARAIGLVPGGWLPSAFAAIRSTAVVMPDRNIVSEIVGRFRDGKPVGRKPDFLELFADHPVRINPLLCALEGNGRAMPDSETARAQLEEATDKIQRALPSAIMMVGPESIDGLLGLIEDSRPGMARKQALLCQLAPTLAAPVARRHVEARWAEAIDAADAHGVPRDALVLLAILSTIVNPTGHCAAKKLLKFHAGYDEGDAYNALSDLRSLDVLLACLAFFPEQESQIFTADRNLALFWVGLGASGIARDGDSATFTLTPHEAVMPPVYAERWAAECGQAGI